MFSHFTSHSTGKMSTSYLGVSSIHFTVPVYRGLTVSVINSGPKTLPPIRGLVTLNSGKNRLYFYNMK